MKLNRFKVSVKVVTTLSRKELKAELKTQLNYLMGLDAYYANACKLRLSQIVIELI